MFAREAEGLQELASGSGPRVPQTYLIGADFLLLEDLQPAPRNAEYWPALGRQLAALHERTQAQFGFAHDNYIGSTLQPNPRMEDGHVFFAEQRLLFQARMAQDRGLLNSGEVSQVEALAARLPDLVPAQSASLLHGDLWGGNAISDAQGAPALIDPAVHYGWAEAELGMTRLFGGFDPGFYRAYVEARPLEPGWEGRLPLYNLYHLLNHLNIFGRGYHSQVSGILQAFA
jgi:fructosamine-3-kinase